LSRIGSGFELSRNQIINRRIDAANKEASNALYTANISTFTRQYL
jgi:hypothetical protein